MFLSVVAVYNLPFHLLFVQVDDVSQAVVGLQDLRCANTKEVGWTRAQEDGLCQRASLRLQRRDSVDWIHASISPFCFRNSITESMSPSVQYKEIYF